MPLTVRWKAPDTPPVEAEGLRPDALAGLAAAEVARLRLAVGNGSAELGELAEVAGDGSDAHLIVEGDLRRVARLGEGMAAGRLEVVGDVGPHLCAFMSGGEAAVRGSAGACAGAEMRGGLLRIGGSAGDRAGAAYPGSRLGMREGILLIEGSAGAEVGLAQRRGLIAVGGAVGASAVLGMVAGSVFAFGAVGRGAGQGMKRGTLALLGVGEGSVPPTFARAGADRPPWLALYLRRLAALGFGPAAGVLERLGPVVRYNGDLASGGRGELLIPA